MFTSVLSCSFLTDLSGSCGCCLFQSEWLLRFILGCLVMNLKSDIRCIQANLTALNTLFSIHRIFLSVCGFQGTWLPDWCFISHLKPNRIINITLWCFDFKSLVKPVIITALPCWLGWYSVLSARQPTCFLHHAALFRSHPYRLVWIRETASHILLWLCRHTLLHLYLFENGLAVFFFLNLAATCSPTPSPMQYHRPLRS